MESNDSLSFTILARKRTILYEWSKGWFPQSNKKTLSPQQLRRTVRINFQASSMDTHRNRTVLSFDEETVLPFHGLHCAQAASSVAPDPQCRSKFSKSPSALTLHLHQDGIRAYDSDKSHVLYIVFRTGKQGTKEVKSEKRRAKPTQVSTLTIKGTLMLRLRYYDIASSAHSSLLFFKVACISTSHTAVMNTG
jgi:hypothetical protein